MRFVCFGFIVWWGRVCRLEREEFGLEEVSRVGFVCVELGNYFVLLF